MGETCGLKLVWDTVRLDSDCRLCEDIAKKNRRIKKLEDDIQRWHSEGNRKATLEKADKDLSEILQQRRKLYEQHVVRACYSC